MKIVRNSAKMAELSRQIRSTELRLGLVPTMGFLHQGHLELVRESGRRCDATVASIFVNPTQFDQHDDFEAYPRDEQRDLDLLADAGVEIAFVPTPAEVYPAGAATTVSVAGLDRGLCGPGRPGHFDGVATVVAALFNIVAPDLAVFGEKDYQQLQIIRRMTTDLRMGVEIVGIPTVREADGLALSSRNARLSPAQRAQAPAIYRALEAAARAFDGGQNESEALVQCARRVLAEAGLELEYLELVDGQTLEPLSHASRGSVLAAAVCFGAVRLIDNLVLGRDCQEKHKQTDVRLAHAG
jgi:pantoate--beta-alanine ligase